MGKLIVFEGPDGSGKTSILDLVSKQLRADGCTVALTRQPGGTQFGLLLRKLLKAPQLKLDPMARQLLFHADFVQHQARLSGLLAANDFVLCDRWMMVSAQAYGHAEGTEPGRRQLLDTAVTTGATIKPDLVVLLSPSLEVAWERTDHEDLCDSDEVMFTRVNQAYQCLADEARTHGTVNTTPFHVQAVALDADGTLDDCLAEVLTLVGERFPRVKLQPREVFTDEDLAAVGDTYDEGEPEGLQE